MQTEQFAPTSAEARLAKVARREGQRFESATWVHKAQALSKEEFKRAVEKHLTGKDTEPWELLYFKVYKSQLPVIEHALEDGRADAGDDQIARLLLGDDLRGFPGRSESGQQ